MMKPTKARIASGLAAGAAVLAILGAAGAVPALASPTTSAGGPPDIVTAPTLTARTHNGVVGYREVGKGSPIQRFLR